MSIRRLSFDFRRGILSTLIVGLFVTSALVGSPFTRTLAGEDATPSQASGSMSKTVNPGDFRVVGTSPLPTEEFRGNLIIFFSEDIASIPDEQGRDSAPFLFEPPLAGKYEVKNNYARFEKNKDVQLAGGVYSVRIHPSLRSMSGKSLPADQPPFQFTMLPFTLNALRRHAGAGEGVILSLSFSIPVVMGDLQSRLTVLDARQTPVPITVADSGIRGMSLICMPAEVALPISLLVPKGLRAANGTQTLAESYRFTYPESTPLRVEGVQWRTPEYERDQIEIRFSSPVNCEALRKYVTLADTETGETFPVNIFTNREMRNPVVGVDADLSTVKSLTLTIAAGLPDTGLKVLPAPHTQTITRETAPLLIGYSYWDYEGVAGPVLQLQFNATVDASAAQEHLSVTPEVGNLKVSAGTYRNIRVSGDWRTDVTYTVTLSPGLSDSLGNMQVKEPITYTVNKTPRVEGVAFGYPGKIYFPRRSSGLMTVEARNKRETTVTLSQLFPSNIVDAMDYLNGGTTHSGFSERLAREIASKTITFPDTPDTRVSADLDIRELLPGDRRGVFSLRLSNSDDYQNTKIVVWTDIGLLGHWQDNEVAVFAHDLFSLEPLALAKVTVYSSKNQSMGSANTDRQGIAVLRNLDKSLGVPRVAVVETANDYAFLDLRPEADDVPGYDPEMPPYNPEAYDAFIYTDRNLYRPGETIHARWIVRTHYGDALANVPLEMRLINPKGQALTTTPTTLSAMGTAGMDLSTEASYLTGRYQIELWAPGARSPITSQPFNIEDFVPNRIKAAVTVAEDRWLAGKPYEVRVAAQHLFGAPASNRRCEASVILRRGAFTSARWPGYRFTNDAEYTEEVRSLGEAQTGDAGQAVFSFTYQPSPKISFPVHATVRGQVFELGGRAVSATADTLLFPSEVCLGLAAATQGEGDTVEVAVAAIRPDETPAEIDSVKVTLEHEVWNYYVRRYSGHNEPRWDKSFAGIQTVEVPLTEGRGATQLTVPGYGYYRVRVYSEATSQFSTLSFYKYWRRIEIVEQARPSLIKLTLDKADYQVGEEVEVRVESPFDGAGLVVLQSGSLEKAARIEVQENVGVARFVLEPSCYPNAWFEATVAHQVKPGQAGVYPYSSFAMVNVPLQDPRREIGITYPELPEEMRPDQDVQVKIETRDAGGAPVAAEVTLAAVDEGIHAILDYQDPDPYSWFQRSRRPDFRRAHYYDQVAYDFDKTPIGGDGLLAKRLGKDRSIGENWIKPVALWSGVAQTDAQGRATINLHVPEFDGQLRLVAVAVTPAATGAKSAKMYVRRPYILRTSMPRFALPGDRFQCRATVFNTTGEPCRARVAWSATGTLGAGDGRKEVEVLAGQEASVLADFAASNRLGQGTIRWEAEIADAHGQRLEHLEQTSPIPVFVPASFQSKHELAILEAGETRTFKNIGFAEDERLETTLSVSANPMLRLKQALKYVAGYPYGCVEQTTSRCLPTYLLRQSSALVKEALPENQQLDYYIRAGIERLFSMQTPSGGLACWPGGLEPYAYGSIYACHFLTLVRRDRSFPLPEANFKALQEYIRSRANGWGDDSSSGMYERAYAHYVLALDGDLGALEQIARFDHITIPRSARYLLAAALALNTQDAPRVAAYLANAPSALYAMRETDGTLNSDIRNTAVELLALLEMKGAVEEIQKRVANLVRYLEASPYWTTQEMAFVVSALGVYLSHVSTNLDAAQATITAPDGEQKLTGAALYRNRHDGPGGEYTVSNTGTAPLFVNFTLAGIPERAEMKEIKEGIGITRSFRTQQGAPFEGAVYDHGESYLVDLAIVCNNLSKNVIVADLLPAGFEIENPRLDADVLAGQKLDGAATPAYLEIRDDRLVVAFDALEAGAHHFYYLVRAVTPGSFQYPPVHAECMYDPAVRGTSMPGSVEIK